MPQTTLNIPDGTGQSVLDAINAAIALLQKDRGGYLSKSVAGGSNVTLTTTEVDNALIAFTGALTANIQVIVPATSFQWVFYNGTSGAYSLTVKTLSGTGIAIPQGKVVLLWCDGTNVLCLDYVSKAGDTLSGALNNAPQVTLASASTVAIGAAASNSVIVTGTTTITAFDSIAAGALRIVKFSGALTLTYNTTSLILPGSANITTSAGDVAIFESQGSGNWTCVSYTRISGYPVLKEVPSGQIAAFGSVPSGWIAAPTVQTLVSTTGAYAGIFANHGYAWGGSGSSFGLPYFPLGYVPIQGSAGVSSLGQMPSHYHNQPNSGGAGGTISAPGGQPNTGNSSYTGYSGTANAGSGTANLSAGMGVQICVKL